MKINKILLHNIQKHEHLVVEFDDSLTAITGESDQGKSSILRALGWVLFNKPSSNELRRKVDGVLTTESYVILYITKDNVKHVIERYVSDKSNIYKLDDMEFKSFKRDVPKPISELFNLDYRINVQKQFDTPFLLGDTSGEVAKMFNDLLGLEEANKLVELINKDITNDKKQIEQTKQQIEQYNHYLGALEEINSHEDLFHSIEDSYQRIESYEMELRSLQECVRRIQGADRELSAYKDFVYDDEEIRRGIKRREEGMLLLRHLLLQLLAIQEIPEIPDLIDLSYLQSDCDYFQKLEMTFNLLEDLRYNICRCDKLIAIEESKLSKVNEQLSQIPMCPTCNRPLEN